MSLAIVDLLAASGIPQPLLPLWAMELMATAFLYAWLFCMGATVGSFLNVVVYRLPRHKNLAYPGSLCPQCGHPIRGNDNIPILSWLLLRGRCRDCGGKIPPRYFLVELSVAVLFLLVLVAEHYLTPGALGFTTRQALTTRDGIPFWCMYATHVLLVTTILGLVLIVVDGFPVPTGFFLPTTIVGFLLPIFWPQIRSVPAMPYPDANVWWAGLIDGLGGLVAAFCFCAFFFMLGKLPKHASIGWSSALGVVLGWQRSIFALPLTLLLCVIAGRILRRSSSSVSDADSRSSEIGQTTRFADRDEASMEHGALPRPESTGDTPVPPGATSQPAEPLLPAMTPDEIAPVPPHDEPDPP